MNCPTGQDVGLTPPPPTHTVPLTLTPPPTHTQHSPAPPRSCAPWHHPHLHLSRPLSPSPTLIPTLALIPRTPPPTPPPTHCQTLSLSLQGGGEGQAKVEAGKGGPPLHPAPYTRCYPPYPTPHGKNASTVLHITHTHTHLRSCPPPGCPPPSPPRHLHTPHT